MLRRERKHSSPLPAQLAYIAADRTIAVATQHAVIALGEDAYFEYLPDQLIPFADSRFEQSARIDLARGASLIWWDMIAPGRDASGEVFSYESLTSTFEVSADGEPVAMERWNIAPRDRPLDSIARLGPYRYFASCYVCRRARARRIGGRSKTNCAWSRIAAPVTMYHGELLHFGRTAWWSAASQ